MVVEIVAVLIALVVISGITIVARAEVLGKEFPHEVACRIGNIVKCSGGLSSLVQSSCPFKTIEEPLDEEQLARLLTGTWWMYHAGTCDFGAAGDEVYLAYVFSVKEDIDLEKFLNEELAAKKGGDEVDITKSDYTYLEENTAGQTICFDTNDAGIGEGKLLAGKPYYLSYLDDQELLEFKTFQYKQDRILISSDPEFDRYTFYSQLPVTVAAVYGAAVAGVAAVLTFPVSAGVLVIGGTVGALSYGTVVGTYVNVITAVQGEEFGGCMVYGPIIKQ